MKALSQVKNYFDTKKLNCALSATFNVDTLYLNPQAHSDPSHCEKVTAPDAINYGARGLGFVLENQGDLANSANRLPTSPWSERLWQYVRHARNVCIEYTNIFFAFFNKGLLNIEQSIALVWCPCFWYAVLHWVIFDKLSATEEPFCRVILKIALERFCFDGAPKTASPCVVGLRLVAYKAIDWVMQTGGQMFLFLTFLTTNKHKTRMLH